jgi:hypothetical protein
VPTEGEGQKDGLNDCLASSCLSGWARLSIRRLFQGNLSSNCLHQRYDAVHCSARVPCRKAQNSEMTLGLVRENQGYHRRRRARQGNTCV